MTNEERTKTLINNIKLNINEQNVYEFGLCVEQWKQILDYIGELQQENQKYKEVIDKLKTNIKNDIDGFRTINELGESNEILELLDIYLDILKEVE